MSLWWNITRHNSDEWREHVVAAATDASFSSDLCCVVLQWILRWRPRLKQSLLWVEGRLKMPDPVHDSLPMKNSTFYRRVWLGGVPRLSTISKVPWHSLHCLLGESISRAGADISSPTLRPNQRRPIVLFP